MTLSHGDPGQPGKQSIQSNDQGTLRDMRDTSWRAHRKNDAL